MNRTVPFTLPGPIACPYLRSMRRHRLHLVCLVLAGAVLASSGTAAARTWTSAAGSTLEAELAGFENGSVTLRKPDGKELTLHVRQLSEADRRFLKDELKRNPVLQLHDIPLFPVKVDRSFGYIDQQGRVVIKPAYRKALPFSEGLGLVEGTHPGFITSAGIPVIGVDKPGPGDGYRPFADGVAPFRKGDLWGLIDKSGRVILEPLHADISRFSHGRAVVRTGSQDQWGIGKRGYIDTTGKMIVAPVYNEALDFSDGLGAVNLEGVYGRWGFIDPSGRMVIEPQFHRAYSFHDGLARAMPQEGGGFGLIDKSGRYVLSKAEETERQGPARITRTTWYAPGDFGCGVAPVRFKGNLFLVDRRGRKVSKNLPYDHVSQFVDGLAVYEADGQLGYIDTEGRVVIPARFSSAAGFKNGLAKVETETETAYIDRNGRIVWKAPK